MTYPSNKINQIENKYTKQNLIPNSTESNASNLSFHKTIHEHFNSPNHIISPFTNVTDNFTQKQ
jgi:hypothetical protein